MLGISLSRRRHENKIVTYYRKYERFGGDRNGQNVAKEMGKRKHLDFWANTPKGEVREYLQWDAARVLRCDQDEVVLMDHGHTVACWQEDGRFADVVTYERH
jgi:hypothetical protein